MAEFKAGQLLRIFVNEHDSWHHEPLYCAIVELLRRERIAGATVFRGVEGFGGDREIHIAKIWDIGGNLPVLIEVVDDEPAIAAVIPLLETMIAQGAMTLERVEYCHLSRERGRGAAR